LLKLKYLFRNDDLAEMLVKHWNYDEESLDMFKHYRISSNAIYPFKYEGKTQLLRFAPVAEKREKNLIAELAFIRFLRDNQYGVLEAVASKQGAELIEVRTPWGEYYASVFRRVAGVQLHRTELSDPILFAYGQALGRLHRLSSQYEPVEAVRWSYCDALDWMEQQLNHYPDESAAREEARLLRNYFADLPQSPDNYGLVHYDFEYDNVFYDEESMSCHVIDFDDAMYHWYAMDIERALNSLQDCVEMDEYEHKKQLFLDGYRTEFELPDNLDSILLACNRFASLYGYTRILRSTAERWEHEPDWMIQLRGDLSTRLAGEAIVFGRGL
jgi:Ser/Thr protein kinase RdoA (MazF antagonist)